MSGGGGDESVAAIYSAKAQMCPASGCTMLTTHLKIWIIAFHVQNSRK